MDIGPALFRQGDVLLRRADMLPPGAKSGPWHPGRRIVLAEGETTGHAHVVDDAGALLHESAGQRWMVPARAATLRHEEQAPITLPAGTYEVIRQRVWTDFDEDRLAGD